MTEWQAAQGVALNSNGNLCGVCVDCVAGRLNFCHQATMETALGVRSSSD
ncbi:hypothetical protein ABZ468_39330 [Streptomyces sp. NPDC005708]